MNIIVFSVDSRACLSVDNVCGRYFDAGLIWNKSTKNQAINNINVNICTAVTFVSDLLLNKVNRLCCLRYLLPKHIS